MIHIPGTPICWTAIFLAFCLTFNDQFRDTLQKIWEQLEDGKEKDAKSGLKEEGVKDADGIVMTTKEAIEAGAEKDAGRFTRYLSGC